MGNQNVRIGIVGTGFGQSAMLPGFRLADGAEVVAICSRRRDRAEAAAQAHGIAMAFDDYHAMLAQARLDLFCVVTPVATHATMTLAAIAAGCHVLCEKPAALDTAEALAMMNAAQSAGVIHMIDHELRFNPTRAKIAELIGANYVGKVRYASIRNVSGMRANSQRAWDWWSELAQGGGALGASGSHQVDLLRWWLGDIVAVSGRIDTHVRHRPDPARGGELRAVDSDDQFSFIAELASGAAAHVFVSTVAYLGGSNQVEIHGDSGSLVLDSDDRLWGQQLDQSIPEEFTVLDPLEGIAGVPTNVWGRSFVHLARELVEAIAKGRPLARGASFVDGLRCQQALDAVRRSHEQRCWIAVEE